jgi:hypothetical protein
VLDWRGSVPGNNSGVNNQETQLTPSTVNPATFGQFFNDPVVGTIYGEPLVKTGVNINGVLHNVVFVATEHDQVYAFDADNPGPALWHDDLLTSGLPGATSITPVPNGVTNSGDIAPEIGISNTMFIDASTNTLYTTAKTQETVNGVNHYVMRLHALNIATGAEKFGGPVTIGDTTIGGPDGGYTDNTNVSIPGTGDGSNGTVVNFNALRENERDGIFEDPKTGLLYLTFTSHGDVAPIHGWILGYDPQTLQLKSVFNTAPNGFDTAIWMGQGMPAMDANGNIFAATGNGAPFNAFTPLPNALGGGGGGLGYQGINNSLAVTFRAFGSSSTGLGENGNFLTPNDLSSSGINFNNGAQASTPDVYSATLSYNSSTQTLTEMLTDTTTGKMFSTSYNANLASLLGGNTAFVGFTGGTGGLNMAQNVLTWTFGNGTTTTIDHSGGFASNSDLAANANASFVGNAAQLTPAANGQAGSIFDTTAQDVSNGFTTTFTFQMKAGSNPVADGMTFTIATAQPGHDYAESVLRIDPTQNSANGNMKVVSSFTPSDQVALNNADLDQGSGGVLLLPDSVGSAAHPHLMVQTGKEGEVYLIDRDNLGGYNPVTNGPDNVVQVLPPGTVAGGAYSTPAYFNGKIYYMGAGDVLKAFSISNGVINPTPVAQTSQVFGFTGASPFITTDGSGDGIVWVLDNHLHGTNGAANGPSVLHAYDANTLQELYNSSENGTLDQLGGAVKFTVPTVANGKVYVPTQNGLYVFGQFPPPTTVPAAPSNLSATATGPNSVVLNWTDNATNARGVKILRSDGNASNFVQIAEVGPFATTFTDKTVNPATKFFYEVVATNALGDSGPSNQVNVQTPTGPSVLQITATGSSQVNLAWTPTAADHYNVLRSTDGVNFSTIANVSANVTSFIDTGLSPDVYFYQVQGFGINGQTAFSNKVQVTVGEPVVIDHSGGFASNSDLTANGSATFTGGVAQLTDGGGGEAGSIFSDQKTDIRSFTTTFTLMDTPVNGAADSLSFVMQADPRGVHALGNGGGNGGYGDTSGGNHQIVNSIAVKFDLYSGGSHNPTTGLFLNGASPGTNDQSPHGSQDIPLTGINLGSGDPLLVTLTYNGTTLTETVLDTVTQATFTHDYLVNIPSIIGGDTAYVGFTAGTGGQTAIQDVQSWKFTPTTQNLAPLAPSNLKVASVEAHDANTSDVTVNWVTNSFNETGYEVWRSTDGVNFTQIATLPPNSMSFTNSRLVAGTYYYKVRAFNANGESNFTNVDSVIVGAPRSTVTVDHSGGFASNGDLTANGSATFFTPNSTPVGIFAGHMNIGNATGDTTFSNANGGTYTLTDNGGDIWNQSDNMQYVYKPLVGDGSIVARLVSANAPDFWNKAGVMIRDDLTTGAANDFMLDTPNPSHQEPVMQWRDSDFATSGDTGNHVGPTNPTPIWLKLVRSGNTFTGYWAPDINGTLPPDSAFHLMATHTTPVMPTTVYVGLAIGNTNGETITATFDHVTVTGTTAPLPTTVARLTDGAGGEAGSVFTTSRVVESNFDTTFTFQFHGGTSPSADGMAFVLQSDPRGPNALGGAGGGLGYGSDHPGGPQGIPNSLAIKFDLFSNAGEGTDSTGLFVNGDSPTIGVTPPDQSVDMTGSGIDLHSQDVFQVHLTYDGTTLTETITDETLASHPSFTHSYTVNIPALIGGNVAYAGFTGGTGGLTTVADVKTWTYSFTEPAPGNGGPPAAPTSVSSLAPAPATSSGSTSTSGTAQADPLAVAASASSSTPGGTNNMLMNLPPTPIVSNGSALPTGSSSSISSGWSAFQTGVLGPIVPASAPAQLAGSIAQSPSALDALELLFADQGNDRSLDPLATDFDETAAI